MTIYARIQDGVVGEIIDIDGAVDGRFNPQLTWVAVDPALGVGVGWIWDGTKFTAPPPATVVSPPPVLESLQQQILAMQAKLALLTQGAVPDGTAARAPAQAGA